MLIAQWGAKEKSKQNKGSERRCVLGERSCVKGGQKGHH